MPLFLSDDMNNSRAEAIVSPLSYKIRLFLNEQRVFYGQITISFSSVVKQAILLDFKGKSLDFLRINDKEIDENSFENLWNGKFLLLPEELLLFDANKLNKVEICFKGVHNSSSDGFFKQTINEKAVIYCSLEPHLCCTVFPCFDQPNLKAMFDVTVIAPQEYMVVSNEACLKKPETSGFEQEDDIFFQVFVKNGNIANFKTGFLKWEFKPTPAISTYLFQLIAGDFKELKCEDINGRIKISFYARTERYADLEKEIEKLYNLHKAIILYYERFCGHLFPFSKCDCVFVPNFTDVGMENVGAIIYDERYLRKYSKKFLVEGFSEEFKEEEKALNPENEGNNDEEDGCFWDEDNENSLIYLIGHELSHMWFGNLVTMSWWDDLWLNESFADFAIKQLLLYEKEKPEYIANFLKNMKCDRHVSGLVSKMNAFRLDSSPYVHPVKGKVTDADNAMRNFDSVTYVKGAVIVNQLFLLMGKTNFCSSLKQYFEENKWKNADSFAFLKVFSSKSLELNSMIALESWFEDWVCNEGYNTLQVNGWTLDEKKGDLEVEITQQTLNEKQVLRFHNIDLAVFGDGKVIVKEIKLFPFKEQRVLLNGIENCNAVLLNCSGTGFVKTVLDSKSWTFFQETYSKVESNLMRSLICFSMAHMADRDIITIKEAKKFLKKFLADEKHPSVLELITYFMKTL